MVGLCLGVLTGRMWVVDGAGMPLDPPCCPSSACRACPAACCPVACSIWTCACPRWMSATAPVVSWTPEAAPTKLRTTGACTCACAVWWLRLCALVARVLPGMCAACVACGGGSHVTVDRHGRLARLTYVGGGSVETGNLVTLVGRHTSFLNGLVRWHGWLCCWWDMRSAAHLGDGSRFETTTPATLLT